MENEFTVIKDLLTQLLADIHDVTGIKVTRDVQTINKRLKHEGLSFVTKTLPAFGKAITEAYQTGQFQRNSCTSFHTRKSRALPEFLNGFTELLFDKKSGVLLDDPCYVCAWAVRQITTFLYKFPLDYPWETERKALEDMIRTDSELPTELWSRSFETTKRDAVLDRAASLLRDVFDDLDMSEIYPKHGPGATNEGSLEQYAKYRFRPFDQLLDSYYPKGMYTSPSAGQMAFRDCVALQKWQPMPIWPGDVSPSAETAGLSIDPLLRTSVTLTVPKDSRGPRVINEEAKELMFMQQGQARLLVRRIESHRLTRGHVNFGDQSINARLALEASLTGKKATLDMKEASDRNSCALTSRLLPDFVFTALWATRTMFTKVNVPIGPKEVKTEVIRLRKFAPMGSAICFPLEAIIFWSLVVAVLQVRYGLSRTDAADDVYVYGDDIIISAQYVPEVVDVLEQCGLKFNMTKSFVRGPFRESCGTDGFLGVDITPVKLKKRMPLGKNNVGDIVGWVATANLLNGRGLNRTAERMFCQVEKILGRLPLGPPDSGILCRETGAPIADYLKPAKRRECHYVPKIAGTNFMILEKDPESVTRTDYHGYLLRGWQNTSLKVKPSTKDFPEEHAWMHYVSLKADTPAVQEDVRMFSPRRVVKLHRVTKVIT